MKRSDNYLINDIKESIKSIEEYLSELNYNKENFLSNKFIHIIKGQNI